MNTVWLIAIILGVSLQNVTKKSYNQKTNNGGVYIFNVVVAVVSVIFFACTSGGKLVIPVGLIPYILGFAVAFSLASVFSVLAISNGSLSLSALVISYSLMVPAVYGLLFLHEKAGAGLYVGIAFLLVSLFLINLSKDDASVSLKWAIFAFLAFVGSGMCSTIQKMQQLAFNGAYKQEFMFFAFFAVMVAMVLIAFGKEREHAKNYVKNGWRLAALCGLMNGLVNLLVMVLSGKMPASVIFPLISAGGIVCTFLISKFVYHEKLSKTQMLGFGFGIASVIFLNI